MASSLQSQYFFPHFPPPPFPAGTPPFPPHFVSPPPPPSTPRPSPTPPHTIPPPPHTISPPPPHVVPRPSPPHMTPPPPPPHTIPPPPPPTPGNHTTIIVVVFVSCGGVFFLAFVMVALWCFLKKKKKMVRKAENVHIDEHRKVSERIVQGPHGTESVVLSVEDDIHIEEDIRKSEVENFRKGLHNLNGDDLVDHARQPSYSNSGHHNLKP